MSKRNPHFEPSRAHHRPGGFRNPPGSPKHKISSELAREAARFFAEMRRLAKAPEALPADFALSEEDALSQYHDMTSPYKLTWLGHASFLITLNGKRLLTDPYLSAYASPLPLGQTRRIVPAAIAVKNIPPLDGIVISHNHYDHLDIVALKKLAAIHPGVPVVVPLGLRALLLKCGFKRVDQLDWYQHTAVAGLTIEVLPAVHASRRGIGDTNRSLWCGFRLADSHKSVYFAGDTAYGEVFREIGKKSGPFDIGLVPIGAYQPRALMRPIHCSPEEAIQIGEDIGARQLVGMHWGTIRLTTEPMLEPRDRFLNAPGSLSRQVMRIGETLPF
jgi:L-ascorbate metabolism protein UlaG (beta-lactamase superfamily)